MIKTTLKVIAVIFAVTVAMAIATTKSQQPEAPDNCEPVVALAEYSFRMLLVEDTEATVTKIDEYAQRHDVSAWVDAIKYPAAYGALAQRNAGAASQEAEIAKFKKLAAADCKAYYKKAAADAKAEVLKESRNKKLGVE